MSFSKEHAIIAQNSATAAAAIVAAEVAAGENDSLDRFNKVRLEIFNGTLALAGTEAVVERMESPSRPSSSPRSGGGVGNYDNVGEIAFNSGKHQGKTIAEVYEEAPDYIEWAAEKLRNDFMRKKCEKYLDEVA